MVQYILVSLLIKKIYEHRNNLIDGFTKKYDVHNLVYFETVDDFFSAVNREKQLKNGKGLGK